MPCLPGHGRRNLHRQGKTADHQEGPGNGKLELSKVLPLYFCLHCGRCDEECQVNLKHRALFDDLEKYLARLCRFPDAGSHPNSSRMWKTALSSSGSSMSSERVSTRRSASSARPSHSYRVRIDEEHCIHCGTCVDACMYSVRKRDESDPRRVVIADEALCRGCGACLERCPQIANKLPATTVELHPDYLSMDDPYWNGEVISRIDLEATTGKIPVSGTGQGDPHRGFGNDGIRFGHFHIVGPAQNLLYESSADAIAIQLGQQTQVSHLQGREAGDPASPPRRAQNPILIDVMPVDGGEVLLDAMIEAAKGTGNPFHPPAGRI